MAVPEAPSGSWHVVMPRLAILCNHDVSRWRGLSSLGERAGYLGPYGFEHLARLGYTLTWSDARQRRPLSGRLARRIEAKVEWTRPELAGWLNGVLSARPIAQADAVVSVFEDQGLGLATARRYVPMLRRKPLVLVVCWLAERVKGYSARERHNIGRALRTADAIVLFSQNQVRILQEEFKLDEERLFVVPFGVDSEYFAYDSPGRSDSPGGSSSVLFVGRDRSRDVDTLLRAAPLVNGRVTVVSGPELLEGKVIPANCTVLLDVDHQAYRRLLRECAVVCIPTHAPAYPGGQTVVLEAMASGRPCVTTDSAAMRDYVTDGITGSLVGRNDHRAAAAAVNRLLADRERADAIARSARQAVEERFSHESMWGAFEMVLASVLGPRE